MPTSNLGVSFVGRPERFRFSLMMVVTGDIRLPSHFDFPQRASPLAVDHQVVNLVLASSIRRVPCKFGDIPVGKQGATYHQVICNGECCQSLTVVIQVSTSMLFHSGLR